MASYSVLRRIFTAILLPLLLSCQSRVTQDTKQTNQTAPNSKQNSSVPNIVYGNLVIKEQSDYIMIPVGLSQDRNQSRDNMLSFSSEYEYGNRDNYYNLIFYSKKDSTSHLLLNKKAIITSFELLEKKEVGKPPTRFWLYEIIENDTNGDKKVNSEDASIGYLSDLSGKNLQQITPNNTQLLSWTVVQSMGAILVNIVQDSDNDKKFTDRDETTFIRVNLANPSIGTEIISDKIKQDIKSILLK